MKARVIAPFVEILNKEMLYIDETRKKMVGRDPDGTTRFIDLKTTQVEITK